MPNHLVMYSKPNCVQCKMTEMLIKKLNYPVSTNYHNNVKLTNVIDINSKNEQKAKWSERKIKSLIKKTNLHQMPVIEVRDDQTGKILDVWGGFQPSKIKKWYVQNQK